MTVNQNRPDSCFRGTAFSVVWVPKGHAIMVDSVIKPNSNWIQTKVNVGIRCSESLARTVTRAARNSVPNNANAALSLWRWLSGWVLKDSAATGWAFFVRDWVKSLPELQMVIGWSWHLLGHFSTIESLSVATYTSCISRWMKWVNHWPRCLKYKTN